MKDGFIKTAAGVPALQLVDPAANAEEITGVIRRAAEAGVHVLVLPELCITGCTCGDLFRQQTLLDAAQAALLCIAAGTADAEILAFVGVPLVIGGELFDCAAAVSGGKILGIVPRTYFSRVSALGRIFSAAPERTSVRIGGEDIPFGTDLLFSCAAVPALTVGAEIGEDAFAPIPPSAALCAAGASVIVHLNGDPETVCAAERRTEMIAAQSARLCCVYVSANAGAGESSTDAAYGGHALIAEMGKCTAQRPPFSDAERIIRTVDVSMAAAERRRIGLPCGATAREIFFDLPLRETELSAPIVPPYPFIPQDAALPARCARILEIQAAGLARRFQAAHAGGAVVAVSGGLDSTLALLATVRAADLLGWEHTKITTVTMPCYGTTRRTKTNAQTLAEELGTAFREIDIAEAVGIHFRDIGHDPADHSVTYENSQARERTQIIMDLANRDNSLVIGTGDLSELALGWATYNGDHMSNYGVNAGLPKTLIRRVTQFCADEAAAEGKSALAAVLYDILATPVSPELLPASDGEISQKTEDIVGPYDLHDFFLWCIVRRGDSPKKIYRMARAAFAGQFDDETIRKWLKTFCRRFFIQQFKRSCLPDGPKIGSVSFSPRTEWHMPSDARSAAWMVECEEL